VHRRVDVRSAADLAGPYQRDLLGRPSDTRHDEAMYAAAHADQPCVLGVVRAAGRLHWHRLAEEAGLSVHLRQLGGRGALRHRFLLLPRHSWLLVESAH